MDHFYKKRIIKGGGWIGLGFGCRALSQFLMSIILTRLLSPAILGDYYLFSNIVVFSITLASLGLPKTLLKVVPSAVVKGDIASVSTLYHRFIYLTFLSVAFLSTVLFFTFPFLYRTFFTGSHSIGITLIVLAWLVFMVFQNLAGSVMRSLQNQAAYAVYVDIIPVVLSLLGLVVIWLNDPVEALPKVLGLLVFSNAIGSVLLYFQFKKQYRHLLSESSNSTIPVVEKLSIGNLKQVLRQTALPFWGTAIMLYFLTKVDVWIVGYSLSSKDVAIYGVALKLTALLQVVFSLLNTVIAPMISELYQKKDLKKLEKIVRTSATLATSFAVVITLLFYFLGTNILTFVFGDVYSAGSSVLWIYGVGITMNIFTGCCGMVLMYTNYQKLMMRITFFTGVGTVIAAILLVKPYGIEGVALSSAVGMIVQNMFMLYFAQKKVGIWTHCSFKYLREVNLPELIGKKQKG